MDGEIKSLTRDKIKEMCDILFNTNILELQFNEELLEVCLMCLTMQYAINGDKRCKEVLRDMIKNSSIPFSKRVFIYEQLGSLNFREIEEKKIELEDAYAFLTKELKEKSRVAHFGNIKKEEIDQGCIVYIITQFLGQRHSPTKVLLGLMKTINDYFEDIQCIYVFNSAELPQNSEEPNWKGAFCANYIEHNQSTIEYMLREAGINRCGVGYEGSTPGNVTIEKLDTLAQEIYDLKPKYIFSIGAQCLLAEICNTFTDVYTWPLSNDFPITDSRYIIQYGRDTQVKEKKKNKYQSILEIPFSLNVFNNVNSTERSREEEGFKKEDFLISVVGNRLQIEVTDEFLKLCTKLMDKHNNVRIVFIGNYQEEEYRSKIDQKYIERFYSLGFQQDIVDAIQISDLYLNPIRSGGGLSCVAAMQGGVPVVSIDYGDVAGYLEPSFIMKDYEEMYEYVDKLISNKEMYKESCEKTERWLKKYTQNNYELLMKYLEDRDKNADKRTTILE